MTTKIPFNNIVKLGQKTMLDSNLFSVSWIIGRFCNYKCSYCWPYANTDKPDYYDLKTYKNAIDEIKRQAIANGYDNFLVLVVENLLHKSFRFSKIL